MSALMCIYAAIMPSNCFDFLYLVSHITPGYPDTTCLREVGQVITRNSKNQQVEASCKIFVTTPSEDFAVSYSQLTLGPTKFAPLCNGPLRIYFIGATNQDSQASASCGGLKSKSSHVRIILRATVFTVPGLQVLVYLNACMCRMLLHRPISFVLDTSSIYIYTLTALTATSAISSSLDALS
jgi:hypothetical protein